MKKGTIFGVGLGPGDPELMSVKADRLVREAAFVAYFRKEGHTGRARRIVEGLLRPDAVEFPMEYPITDEIPFTDPRYNEILSAFYTACTDMLLAHAESGRDAIVLCEGDPFFYGSFMHLHVRLKDRVPVTIVPAITGMSAAWKATGQPVTWGDDVLSVVMGTLPEDDLVRHMQDADALVVMKVGRNIAKVRRALIRANRADAAWLVEHASTDDETVRRLSDVPDATIPYFSIIVVHSNGRRP